MLVVLEEEDEDELVESELVESELGLLSEADEPLDFDELLLGVMPDELPELDSAFFSAFRSDFRSDF